MNLLGSTGDARADAILRTTIEAFEAAFPERVRGYYLHGSLADGTGLPTSDLDLAIIFCEQWGDDERAAAQRLRARCMAGCALELDIELSDEAELAYGMDPNLKLGSRVIAGVDIRDAYPIVPLDVWARDRLHTSYWRLINLFARPLPVIAPLAYPDANDEFFGYLRRKTRLPDGHEQIGTRDLIRATGWAATALLALQAQTYVARKRDCHRLYRERIGGAWADLLAEIYARCRGVWHSTVPEAPEERRALRSICARTLGFENYFLGIYRDYLLVELASRTPEHRARAREMLAQVPWDDAALAAALCAAPG